VQIEESLDEWAYTLTIYVADNSYTKKYQLRIEKSEIEEEGLDYLTYVKKCFIKEVEDFSKKISGILQEEMSEALRNSSS
jgi:hypothetical protein